MDRNLIIQEYAQLRVYLNKSNKLADEKTILGFEIYRTDNGEYRLFAYVKSSAEKHRVAISIRNRFRNWERTGFSPFESLENFCAELLNLEEKSIEGKVKNSLSADQQQLLAQLIQNTFKKLEF